MNLENKEKLLALHQEARKGLVECYKTLLSDAKDYAAPADFHYRVSDVMLNEKSNFAIEMFRESAKSTYVLKTFPIYKLMYPDDDCRYIVIIKNNQTLADSKLKEIADEYLSNPALSFNVRKVHTRSGRVFDVTVRGPGKKDYRIRIEAYGKGASIRGLAWGNLRPQIVICDDLQDLEDAESETVTEKDWTWFLSDINFLAKKGRIVIIGNNLGERCIIERILNSPDLDYESIKIPALNDEGESNWPEAFSTEFLLHEKDQFVGLGKIDIWYRERMCIAIPDELKVFRKEDFRYFEQHEITDKFFEYYVTVDLAISQKKTADDTVICVVGKELNKPYWYVIEMIGGRLDPLQTIDALFMVQQKYRPVRIGIESVAYQKALFYFIEEEQRKRGVYFAISEIKSLNKKEERIKGLQPMFKTGIMFMRKNEMKLEEQLLSFPKGLHDDYPDALSMQIQLMENTHRRVESRKKHAPRYEDPLAKYRL